jgi:FO synthase
VGAQQAQGPNLCGLQASWVKMGPENAARLLAAGANDMGGVLMNESITRAAGAEHGQQIGAAEMESLVSRAAREPWQRTTLYRPAPQEQILKSLACSAELLPARTIPAYRLVGSGGLRAPGVPAADA